MEPAKAEEAGQKLGEVTKKNETSEKPTKNSESNIYKKKQRIFTMIEEEKDDHIAFNHKDYLGDKYRS